MKILKDVEINFQTKDLQTTQPDYNYLGEVTINKPERKVPIIGIARKVHVKITSIRIQRIELPEGLVVSGIDQLLTLELGGKHAIEHQDHTLNQNTLTVPIKFDKNQVQDYEGSQTVETIKFEVVAELKENKKKQQEEEDDFDTDQPQIRTECEFKIRFEKGKISLKKPEITVLENELVSSVGYEYHKARKQLLQVRLQAEADFRYVDPIQNCQLTLSFDGNTSGEVIEVGKYDITPSNIGQQAILEGSKVTILELPVKKTVTIPVYINLDKISEPHQLTQYHLTWEVTADEVPTEGDQIDLFLKPDNRIIELKEMPNLLPAVRSGIQHHGQTVQIGNLFLECQSTYDNTLSLVELAISLNGEENRAIFWEQNAHLIEINGEGEPSLDIRESVLKLEGIRPGQQINIPYYLNVGRLDKPLVAEEWPIDIKTTYQYQKDNELQEKTLHLNERLTLLPDGREVELVALFEFQSNFTKGYPYRHQMTPLATLDLNFSANYDDALLTANTIEVWLEGKAEKALVVLDALDKNTQKSEANLEVKRHKHTLYLDLTQIDAPASGEELLFELKAKVSYTDNLGRAYHQTISGNFKIVPDNRTLKPRFEVDVLPEYTEGGEHRYEQTAAIVGQSRVSFELTNYEEPVQDISVELIPPTALLEALQLKPASQTNEARVLDDGLRVNLDSLPANEQLNLMLVLNMQRVVLKEEETEKVYAAKLRLSYQDYMGKTHTRFEAFEFKLLADSRSIQLMARFEVLKAYRKGLQYQSRQQPLPLGTLHLSCEGERSDTLTIENAMISLSNQSNLVFGEPEKRLDIVEDILPHQLTLSSLRKETTLSIPLLIDLSRTYNPVFERQTEKEPLTLEWTYNGKKRSPEIPAEIQYTLLQDENFPSFMLGVFLDDTQRQPQMLGKNEPFVIERSFLWEANSDASQTCFDLFVKNTDIPGLIVNELDFKFEFQKGKFEFQPGQTLATLFELDGESIADFNQTLLPERAEEIASEAGYRIPFAFLPGKIKELPEEYAGLACTLTVHYTLPPLEKAEEKTTRRRRRNRNPSTTDPLKQEFTTILHFGIQKDLGSHWLALDFGTSAIVASFADSNLMNKPRNTDDDILLNLQAIDTTQYQPGKAKNADSRNLESDTFFLSSELMLRNRVDKKKVPFSQTSKDTEADQGQHNQANNKEDQLADYPALQSRNYAENLLLFGPSFTRILQSLQFKLPYLKSLIGFGKLPPLHNEELERMRGNYQYCESAKDTQAPRKLSEQPILVNQILANAYKSVIRDFVTKAIEAKDPKALQYLNKIVLSFPNTFTPRHIQLIKNIVKEFENQQGNPLFREENIAFISESDAIAFNYNNFWSQFNQDYPERVRPDKEYVMVYDMGAGTTDVTYLCITRHFVLDERGRPLPPQDDAVILAKEAGKLPEKVDIEIIGRLGKQSAGNYLDYVINEIIQDIIKAQEKQLKDFGFEGTENFWEIFNLNLKYDIQQIIKPKLAKDNDQPLIFMVDEDKDIDRLTIVEKEGDIINNDKAIITTYDKVYNHELMEQYVDENSIDLFEKFFGLYQAPKSTEYEKDRQVFEKGKVPIDTVIFSGRSTQFDKITEAVLDELDEWRKPRQNEGVVNDEGVYEIYLPDNQLKSAVVVGALEYASKHREQAHADIKILNRNLQARYGVLYQNVDNQWEFKEMLNPMTRSTNRNPEIKDGLIIYEYDTDVYDAEGTSDAYKNTVDLNSTEEGYFVQSFANDTAAEINAKRWEYVSVIFSFRTRSVTPKAKAKAVKVRVQVNDQNEMTIKIGNQTNKANSPLKIDLENNQTYRRSLWPYVNDNTTN